MSCCPPSPSTVCPPDPRAPVAPPDAPSSIYSTVRPLVCNTEQSYTANRPAPVTVTLTDIVVSYDGNLTITGSADVFDTIANATQIEITGLSILDGHRTVTVYPETNSIVFASYHSKGATTYLIDPETGEYLIDPETGDFIIASEGGIPPGDYTVTIVAIIGTTSEPSCTITVSAGEFCCECQDAADAAALASAQSQAEECIEEDPSLLYRNSDIEYTATCPSGSTGESESVVAYNTYTSTISQQDADQKALNVAIFSAMSSLLCMVDGCSWGGEVYVFPDNGTTGTPTYSSSASGVDFSLDLSGIIDGYGIDSEVVLSRTLTISKYSGVVSGTVDFDVTALSGTVSVESFFGVEIIEDGNQTSLVEFGSDSFSTGPQSVPYSTLGTSQVVEIRVFASMRSSGGLGSGDIELTGEITGTPCE